MRTEDVYHFLLNARRKLFCAARRNVPSNYRKRNVVETKKRKKNTLLSQCPNFCSGVQDAEDDEFRDSPSPSRRPTSCPLPPLLLALKQERPKRPSRMDEDEDDDFLYGGGGATAAPTSTAAEPAALEPYVSPPFRSSGLTERRDSHTMFSCASDAATRVELKDVGFEQANGDGATPAEGEADGEAEAGEDEEEDDDDMEDGEESDDVSSSW